MKKYIYIFLIFTEFTLFSQQNLIQYVNPFIGTGGHGHTFPGASVPFGMVQLSPDTRLDGWDGCSGYHHSDKVIYGFSHTHLSGTGCSDYGDILIMPVTGKYSLNNKQYSSKFNHKNEKATPGYYSVQLDKYDIFTELTASARCGYHKYSFKGKKSKYILIDLKHRDEVIDSKFEFVNDTTIIGYRFSKNWADNQKVFFAIVFSEKIHKFDVAKDNKINENATLYSKSKYCFSGFINGKNLIGICSFDTNINNLELKVGISAVSTENALKNINSEIANKSFAQVKTEAEAKWQKELSKIIVEGQSEADKVKFYTALYHCYLQPNLYSDATGEYRGRDDKIHQADFDYYTVFSLWDTYRAYHPLMTIIDTKRTNDWIRTFLKQYEQGGRLPVWELSSCETNCMIGYHSVPVIADAIMKNIGDFDKNLALKAMLHSANLDHFGLKSYKNNQYISADDEHESVSKTLEYAFDDWCIAQTAKKIDNTEIYNEFIKRSQYYKNIFDPKTDFMRARSNGDWVNNFNPTDVNNNYTEGNSWQYSFYVPHDVNTLIDLMGGKKAFYEKLEELFTTKDKLTGREQVDITGLIGQYAHGNEPSHHIAYLFNYVNSPNRTQELVRKIMSEFYTDKPDGLIGNEDCGQMSAWFVLSAMGFYQVAPGSNEYTIGSPLFDKITINLENGKNFIIKAKNNSPENIYVQSLKLNGKPLYNTFLSHNDLNQGGEIEFVMDKYKSNFGIRDIDCPKSKIDNQIVLSPIINFDNRVFKESAAVSITTSDTNAVIYYTTDDTYPYPATAKKYNNRLIKINNSTIIKAIAVSNGKSSPLSQANLYKAQDDKKIKIISKVSPGYQGDGPDGLIDNLRGNTNFRLGGWHGYQGLDFEAIIELNNKKIINEISAGFLQDSRSWVVFPKEVSYYCSDNGKDFKLIDKAFPKANIDSLDPQIENIGIKTNISAKYIKIIAKYYGKLPARHQGAGGESFIFIDEITIK